MGLVDPDTFSGKEVVCIYIAARRSEARRVEEILSSNGIDYGVDIEPFETTLLGLFKSQRDGVGFFVLADQAEVCRQLLREARMMQGLVDEDEEQTSE